MAYVTTQEFGDVTLVRLDGPFASKEEAVELARHLTADDRGPLVIDLSATAASPWMPMKEFLLTLECTPRGRRATLVHKDLETRRMLRMERSNLRVLPDLEHALQATGHEAGSRR